MHFEFSKQAKHNLRNYGKTLMEAEPDKTTELLKLLCTDYKSSESKLKKLNLIPRIALSVLNSSSYRGPVRIISY